MNNYTIPTTQERAERRKARQRRARRQRAGAVLILLIVVAAICAVVVQTQANETAPAPIAATTRPPEMTTATLSAPEPPPIVTETPEATAEVSGAADYITDAIPLSAELQAFMWEECERWGCPYNLALAVAEVESQFNMDAVGAVGEVGIMQLNPGPGGAYHDELEATTGLDPTTPEGNISGGVYLLGSFMSMYDDPAKAAMAYNMGHSGAIEAWAAGVTTSKHTEKVLDAMIRWGHVLESSAEAAASDE